jgi:CBS-domain-containing membrane protein
MLISSADPVLLHQLTHISAIQSKLKQMWTVIVGRAISSLVGLKISEENITF